MIYKHPMTTTTTRQNGRIRIFLPWIVSIAIFVVGLQTTLVDSFLFVRNAKYYENHHKSVNDHQWKTTTTTTTATTTTTTTTTTTKTTTTLSVKFFDSLEELLFPTEQDKVMIIDRTKELASYSFTIEKGDDMDVARSSLEHFLNQWAFQLATASTTSASKNGLSTPISAGQFQSISNTNQKENEQVSKDARLRIIFRPPPRYLSYNEQKSMEKGTLPDRKGAKLDSKSPGGMDILVTYNNNNTNNNNDDNDHDNEIDDEAKDADQSKSVGSYNSISIVVRRSCFDSDTILKESSERAIIRRLDEAMRIWQKVRAMKV